MDAELSIEDVAPLHGHKGGGSGLPHRWGINHLDGVDKLWQGHSDVALQAADTVDADHRSSGMFQHDTFVHDNPDCKTGANPAIVEIGGDSVVSGTDKKRQKAQRGKRPHKANTPGDRSVPQVASALPGSPPPGFALVPLSPPLVAERALQQRQRKQKWTGSALPKRDKVKRTVALILAKKVMGFSTNEIAEELGIKAASVRQYLYIAGREGWLDTRDPHEKVHSELVHRAVSNLEEWMTARDSRTGLPDKEVTLETAKLMLFNNGGPAQQAEGGHTNVLAIQITMPQAGVALPQMREGNAGGEPAYCEGEVLNAPRS